MLRLAFRLCAILLISCTATSAFSAEPHQEWWKYLKGTWTYEFSPLGMKGEATWRLAAKGNAIVGRFRGDDSSSGIELGGLQDGKVSLKGFGSNGNYWNMDFSKVTADSGEAKFDAKLLDGTTVDGKFTYKKVDENKWTWRFVGKDGDGKDTVIEAVYNRKPDAK